MKIILIKDVKKQGKTGDILNVKDGYGTFLIKNGSAVLATDASLNRLNRENKEKKIEEEQNIKKCESIKKNLEKLILTFKVKTGAEDKVFGSISTKQISDELKKKGYEIDKKQINISNGISSLGYHNVEVNLHKKVNANLKIELVK